MNDLATRERAAPTTVFTNTRALMVKNLRPGLAECGKIKIGVKGELKRSSGNKEFQPPRKLDHFIVTTLNRGPDDNFLRDEAMHARLGDRPTELPVRLVFNDPWLNFQTSYQAFRGKTRYCTGDGESAQRLEADGNVRTMACPCPLLDMGYEGQDKCKIHGTLSVVIDGAGSVGGVWKLRTTSINTCQGIASSLALIASLTGGQLAGIPLVLSLRPKATVTPKGQATTVYVVGLEYRGEIDELRAKALGRARDDAAFGERMARIEDEARRMLEAPTVGENDMETVEEFYPDAARRAHGLPALTHRTADATDDRADAADAAVAEMLATVGVPAGDLPEGEKLWVYDTDESPWSHAATHHEWAALYRDLKGRRSDKAAVASANLDMLRACFLRSKEGSAAWTSLKEQIEAAEAQADSLDGQHAEPVEAVVQPAAA